MGEWKGTNASHISFMSNLRVYQHRSNYQHRCSSASMTRAVIWQTRSINKLKSITSFIFQHGLLRKKWQQWWIQKRRMIASQNWGGKGARLDEYMIIERENSFYKPSGSMHGCHRSYSLFVVVVGHWRIKWLTRIASPSFFNLWRLLWVE